MACEFAGCKLLYYVYLLIAHSIPSVLWRCWLGGRKGIRPVKNWVVGCWRGYLSGARCRLACGPADTTATHCFLLQENPDWFLPFWYWLTRVVPEKGPLNGCVCVCVHLLLTPSVLWHCWLGVRKSIRPVRNWVVRCWCGYLSGVRCRLFAYGPDDAIASQNPIISRLI